MTRRICVVTGSRADYGHLQPVMRAIAADPALTLQTVVCGQHLDPHFGGTWKAITADGFTIDGRVEAALRDDSNIATTEVTGATVAGIARELERLKPDLVLVLGDRYEILGAGVAALLMKVPLAHIHGGEITEGAFDDSIRHALSKMAALHFVATAAYKARLVQMGEDPDRVIVSGAPGLDDIGAVAAADPEALTARLGIEITHPLLLITYHPVTLQNDAGQTGLEGLLLALGAYTSASMIFTGVNSDPGHEALRNVIAAFVAKDPHRRAAVESLGRAQYLSVMKTADAVIGNSSSGLIEAPSLGVPSVNIGDRQKGRMRSASVVDCDPSESAIRAALMRALDPPFRTAAAQQRPAYGGGAAASIVATLKDVPLMQLSTKRFRDIIFSN